MQVDLKIQIAKYVGRAESNMIPWNRGTYQGMHKLTKVCFDAKTRTFNKAYINAEKANQPLKVFLEQKNDYSPEYEIKATPIESQTQYSKGTAVILVSENMDDLNHGNLHLKKRSPNPAFRGLECFQQ